MEEQTVSLPTATTPTTSAEKNVVTKITSDKPKDPKRVAQGKRLVEISREAKERKMRERVQAENAQNKGAWTSVAITAAAVGTIGYLAGTKIYPNKEKPDKAEPKNKALQPSEPTLDMLG